MKKKDKEGLIAGLTIGRRKLQLKFKNQMRLTCKVKFDCNSMSYWSGAKKSREI